MWTSCSVYPYRVRLSMIRFNLNQKEYKVKVINTLYRNEAWQFDGFRFGFMVFNATFNNISVISWWSVLLMQKTTDLPQVTDKLYYIMLYTSPWAEFELIASVVIGTDCIGSCKSNYHTITTVKSPKVNEGKLSWYM